MRLSTMIAPLFILCSLMLGCGGYSSDEAKQVCDLERTKPCQNDETYAACISCFEECGSDCATLESCPVQYACTQ
jgi:hypothetical protein